MLYGLVLNNWSLVPVKLQGADSSRIHTSCALLDPDPSEIDSEGQVAMTL